MKFERLRKIHSLKEQVSVIDESYLVGISNKGILNRSFKELPEAQVKVTLGDDLIEAVFADGTTVKITGALTNYDCSCPSRAICKHVVMALLAANAAGGAPVNAPLNDGNAYNYLLDLTQETLVKIFGKTVFNDVLFKITKGETCIIEEGSVLVIKTNGGVLTSRFLPDSSLEESICSCKLRNCRHRLEAIMQFIKHKTGELRFELISKEADVDTSIIPLVVSFIEDIYKIGLFRLPPEYSEKCAQFATLCHGAGFAVFERLFDTCAKELELYERKNADFNKNRLIKNLAIIYQAAYSCKKYGGAAEIAGRFKRRYMELPSLKIFGLGAYPWYEKSGFFGVTALFYSPEVKQTLTFTLTRPEGSAKRSMEQELKQMMKSQSAWNIPTGFGSVSKSELSLSSVKISDDYRLSSSKNTIGSLVTAPTCIMENEIRDVVFDDFTQVKNLFLAEPGEVHTAYAVLKIAGINNAYFDKITQAFYAELTDKHGNCLMMTVKHSQINETAILNFEHLLKEKAIPEAITVSVWVSQENYRTDIFPVAVWHGGEISNIVFEKLYYENKQSDYAKFFDL